MATKSTRKRRQRKSGIDRPPKPYPDFPLSAANIGRWQKKINGKIHYFGRWGKEVDAKMTRIEPEGCWQSALEEYEQKRDALYAGRKPREKGEELTVVVMCDAFLVSKKNLMESGEITARTFMEYCGTTDRLAAMFGRDRPVDDLGPEDFNALRASVAKQWGPVRLGNEVQRVRSVFKFALESGLIDKPTLFGPRFKKPTRKVLRQNRAASAKKLFTAEEIHALLGAASPQVKAMILLGVNCGFGNGDCASLSAEALDLERGWVDYARPKTGIPRRCSLWPETVAALRAAIAKRPTPKDPADADAVFMTKYGHRWVRTQGTNHVPVDSVCLEFGKLLRALHINGRRGLGFYALRHTFRTVADPTKDFPAIRYVMGHADESIDATYRERIEDSRLVAVAEHVRKRLFGDRVQ
jgi:integrase